MLIAEAQKRSEESAKRGAAFLDEFSQNNELKDEGGKSATAEIVNILTKLAELSPLEYEQQRKQAAKDLGFRENILDQEVKKLRIDESNGAGEGMVFDEPEPWHEQVNGAELLNEITLTLKRFVILPDKAAEAIALWIVFTYTFDAMRICPILALTSPEKRCGKTTALSLLLTLSNRAIPASNITPAALFRATERWKPTLMIDEADTFLRDNDELRGIVNSGHTRDMAFVIRTVGDDHEPKRFSTWAPKAIAAIGTLKDTLIDRSIVIQMRRKTAAEKVERLKNLDTMDIKRRCIRWAQDSEAQLKVSDPILPEKLHDRAADNWAPLVSIADMAGGDWPELARKAAIVFTQAEDDESIKIQLLMDIKSIFETENTDRIWTDQLVDSLKQMDERPWSEWRKGKGLNARSLSQLLKSFSIRSKDIRIDQKVKKGYLLESFNDTFPRYIPSQNATTLQTNDSNAFSDIQNATQDQLVADRKPLKTAPHNDCSVVADRNGDMGGLERIEL